MGLEWRRRAGREQRRRHHGQLRHGACIRIQRGGRPGRAQPERHHGQLCHGERVGGVARWRPRREKRRPRHGQLCHGRHIRGHPCGWAGRKQRRLHHRELLGHRHLGSPGGGPWRGQDYRRVAGAHGLRRHLRDLEHGRKRRRFRVALGPGFGQPVPRPGGRHKRR